MTRIIMAYRWWKAGYSLRFAWWRSGVANKYEVSR